MMPTTVISSPDDHHEREVISDFDAPTRKCAAMLTANAIATASNPPTKKNGMMGIKAPTAVDIAADPDDTQGLGKWCSESPSSCCAMACTICSGFSASRSAMRCDSSSLKPCNW